MADLHTESIRVAAIHAALQLTPTANHFDPDNPYITPQTAKLQREYFLETLALIRGSLAGETGQSGKMP